MPSEESVFIKTHVEFYTVAAILTQAWAAHVELDRQDDREQYSTYMERTHVEIFNVFLGFLETLAKRRRG